MKAIPTNALSREMINHMINELSYELKKAKEEHFELKDGKAVEEDLITSKFYYVFPNTCTKLKEDMPAKALIEGKELDISIERVTKDHITILCPYIGKAVDSLTIATDASFILKRAMDKLSSFKNYNSEIINAILTAGEDLLEETICLEIDDVLYRVFNQSIVGIWGPPGTGKTTFLSKIMPTFCDHNRYGKILVVAPSNQAVDEAAFRTISNYKGSGCIVRYGQANEEIKRLPNATPSKILQSQEPELFKRAEYLEAKVHNTHLSEDERKYNHELLQAVKKIIYKKEIEIVKGAECVFTTISKAIIDTTISSCVYDTVIIDEVGMTLLPMLLVVIQNAKRVIFLGDFKQLPGIVQS